MNTPRKSIKDMLKGWFGDVVVSEETNLSADQLAELNTALEAENGLLNAANAALADMTTKHDAILEELESTKTLLEAAKVANTATETALAAKVTELSKVNGELSTLKAWKEQQGLALGGAEDAHNNAGYVSPYQAHANSFAPKKK